MEISFWIGKGQNKFDMIYDFPLCRAFFEMINRAFLIFEISRLIESSIVLISGIST
jgi:hypothetical protein